MQSPSISQAVAAELPVLSRAENAMDVQEPIVEHKLHPAFASPEGDTILSARGGQTFFRVHSYTLKTTSGFFKAMYDLPQ